MSIETEDTVARDADKSCTICKGAGWHWGWTAETAIQTIADLRCTSGFRAGRKIRVIGEPVMLRCPCVDRRRRSLKQKVA